MITYHMEQYTDDYWKAKLGRLSASSMEKIISPTGRSSSQDKEYVFKQLAELETGYHEETANTAAMKRGLALEPAARESFTFLTGLPATEVGVVLSSKYEFMCCSPDILGETYGAELKCPSPGVHLKYRFDGVVPLKYRPQVYTSLWICDEVDEWYFMSHHPDMTDFYVSVNREDPNYITYVTALEKKLPEILEFIEKVKRVM